MFLRQEHSLAQDKSRLGSVSPPSANELPKSITNKPTLEETLEFLQAKLSITATSLIYISNDLRHKVTSGWTYEPIRFAGSTLEWKRIHTRTYDYSDSE